MTPQNESPKIPSFNPTGKKESDAKGGSGPLSLSGKTGGSGGGIRFPNLRVRGLSGGASIIDRFKSLRKKDLVFIASGLSVLCMAPVAEHLMMGPEQEVGMLEEGFDSKGPLFPDGTTIYESGTGGFAPGGLVGQGTDVITPLNVRDPSALVMGPGATRKPSATVDSPPTPKSGGSWKDALAQSAKAGAKGAIKKSGKLPKPSVKMSGSLRGLSALSGSSSGGGPSFKLEAPSSAGVPSRARESGALTRASAVPGYRGAARRGMASSGSPESMRAAGGRQADIFNKAASAADSLQSAADEAIPTGDGLSTSGGSPGDGSTTENPGGTSTKDSKALGESLEFLRQKMEMEKRMNLDWKKKEWNEFGKKKMIEETVLKTGIEGISKLIFDPLGKIGEKAA
ncbi:MAG: hypothetical protein ABII00_06720, partial [Elusimicrobiota bacterium]